MVRLWRPKLIFWKGIEKRNRFVRMRSFLIHHTFAHFFISLSFVTSKKNHCLDYLPDFKPEHTQRELSSYQSKLFQRQTHFFIRLCSAECRLIAFRYTGLHNNLFNQFWNSFNIKQNILLQEYNIQLIL